MRGSPLLVVALLLAAPAAQANHQPPSDAGEMPVTFSFAKTGVDAGVRTSILVTGGPGPALQRLVYGTAGSALHLQTLERGSPIGPPGADPEPGVDLDEGPVNDTSTFGTGVGTVDPVDTSTEQHVGNLLAAHNDNGAVHIAVLDAQTGALAAGGQAVAESLGCTVNSTPALTPPDETGDRLLFVALTGGACRIAGLVRIRVSRPLGREIALGEAESVPIGDLNPVASPAVVYLDDGGAPRPFVAVAAGSRVLFYPAAGAFAGAQPAFAVALPAGEVAQTPVALRTGTGMPAGAPGSGAARAPRIYVSSQVGSGESRIHRIVRQGGGGGLAIQGSSPNLAGAPAPVLATSEVAEGAGLRPGRIVLTTSAAAHVVDPETLAPVGSLAGGGATNELGFSRTVAVISGDYAYLARDNGEPIVLRVTDAHRIVGASFTPVQGHAAGGAFGAPAVSRGTIVWGNGSGAFAYRNRDVTPPAVELTAPAARSVVAGTVTFQARAGDARGVRHVDFRLIGRSGNPKVVARDSAPDDGSPFLAEGAIYTGSVKSALRGSGTFTADVVVTDVAGNAMVSSRRTVQIKGRNRAGGRCANRLLGGRAADLLSGTAAGDAIYGRGGRDTLRGQAGNDCLFGEGGSDTLVGGPGADRLFGGGGSDTLDARDGRRDMVDCGPGRDRARVDRSDRVRRCERVSRRRR